MDPVNAADTLSPWMPGIFSLAVFALAVLILMGLMLALTAWLGEKRQNPEKQRPYESGIIPTGTARIHYPVPFFLVAVFFLIFDVEGAFIFTWAVALKQLGFKGLAQMTFFIFVLLAGLVYIWRKGGLDWYTKSKIR